MCEFCDDLKWREYKVLQRNNDACDNLCEIITAKLVNIDDEVFSLGSDCSGCDGCKDYGFKLFTYDNRIGFNFTQNIKQLHIGRNSEMLDINFCPWCGRKLVDNKNIVDFSKCQLGMKLELSK